MAKKNISTPESTTPKINGFQIAGLALLVGFGIVYVASQSSWLLLLSATGIGVCVGFVFGWTAKENLG